MVHPGTGVAADLASQGFGAEVLRRTDEGATDAVCRDVQAVVEGRRRIAQDAAQTSERVNLRRGAEADRGASGDVVRAVVPPDVAKGGLRDVRREVTGPVEGAVKTNLYATQEPFRLADPAAYVELQQRFVREYMDALMQGTATLVRAVRRTADETLRPLEEQVERTQQARQHHRTAAE